jgi:hypothetical protein
LKSESSGCIYTLSSPYFLAFPAVDSGIGRQVRRKYLRVDADASSLARTLQFTFLNVRGFQILKTSESLIETINTKKLDGFTLK